MPSIITDNPPALEGATISQVFAKHINALHSARKAFIQSESSNRIRRALRHQVRATNDHFETGNKVYYKRDDSPKWKGPGMVIGQDGKVVFVRHGSTYARVSPCRLLKVGNEFNASHEQEHTDDQHSISACSKMPLNNNLLSNDLSDDEEKGVVRTQEPSDVINAIKDVHDLPKVKDPVQIRFKDSDNWIEGEVLSRGGKSTGKYSSWFNVKNLDTKDEVCIDFKNHVDEWNKVETSNVVIVPNYRHEEASVFNAKRAELNNWKAFNVIEEVVDVHQPKISTRWVVTEKLLNFNKVIKARLVVRGFEEEGDMQRDSPTAAKDTLRVFFALSASKKLECAAIDVKAAFLQGHDIERNVYVLPPKEADVANGNIWKLKKVVYGLNDAPRNWFFSVRRTLLDLKCKQSSVDKALFYWYDDTDKILLGIFIMHVDDFIYSGTKVFKETVINRLIHVYKVGKIEENSFKYIGIQISNNNGTILVDQTCYVSNLEEIPISKERALRKNDELSSKELSQLRSTIGQLNWLANQTRPDITYDILEHSVSIKSAKVENILQVNKIIKKVKTDEVFIQFPDLGDVSSWKLVVYTDASYANIPDGVSSAGGNIIFIVGENNRCCPISWCSNKIKRVVKSTIAAEALSLVNGLDNAFYVGCLLSKIIFPQQKENGIPIISYIDNKSLFENVHATTLVSEKRLRVDLAAIQQMVNKDEVTLRWIPAAQQLSDCLTKRGASVKSLVRVLSEGYIDLQ